MSVTTLRPNANGTVFEKPWHSKAAKEPFEEVAQEAVEPAAPLTTRGIASPAEANSAQAVHFTWPALAAGQKITSLVVHINGNWTTKLRVIASDLTGSGLTEGILEAAAGGELKGWMDSAKNTWTKIKGSGGSTFPWSPWSQEQLEKLKGGENFVVEVMTGKASVSEIYEIYCVVTIEGGNSVTCSDTIEVSESSARIAGAPRTAADTVSLSGSAARTVLEPRACGDTVTVSEGILAGHGNPRTASDSITVSDAVARSSSSTRTTTDTVTISDTATRTQGAQKRTAADTITVTDAAVAAKTATRTSSDTVTITDSASRHTALHATASDTVTVTSTAGQNSDTQTVAGRLTFTQRTAGRITARHATAGALTATDGRDGFLTARS